MKIYRRMKPVVVVDSISATLLVGALVLAIPGVGKPVPPLIDGAPLPLALDSIPSQYAYRKADSTMHEIIRTNVMSSSRREPRTHFAPPGSDAGNGASMSLYEPTIVSSDDARVTGTGIPGGVADSDAVPGLSGIVFVDGTPRALLVLKTGDAPRLFAVGDRYAGYRVQAIDRDRVVLSSGGSMKTLKMHAPSVPDSLETSP